MPPRRSFEAPTPFNIADHFLDARVREGSGGRVALRVGDKTFSYAEVQELSERYAFALADLGVRPEERVLVSLPDGEDFVGAFFGILRMGAVVVMVNPALSVTQVHDLLEYSRASAAIVDSTTRPIFEEARKGVSVECSLLRSEPCRKAGDAATAPWCFPTHADDTAIWLFSGGTTGRPKAVLQSHLSFANTTELYAKGVLDYGPDDITISVPKLFFGYATGSNLLFPFSVGASTVLYAEKPSAEVLFEQIRKHRPTILINVPTMIHRMLRHPKAGEQDLSCLRFATSAGEALPAPLYEAWRETFGPELLDGLGTAEMWHVFLSNRPGDVRPGTLGRAVPGFEVSVRDEEGRELPPGEVGRLWVRGRSRALCYWQESAKSEAAFRGEYFVGGDLVSMDADGYVTYCGRDDDVLKVAGRWMAPKEVEDCLLRHVAVRECAVIGVPDNDGLTKPWAFVIADGPGRELEQDLKDFVISELERYKHPRKVVFMEDFPRTHLGKVDRGKLRAQATA